jgi:outer membrane receptor protein involved in Fe transport
MFNSMLFKPGALNPWGNALQPDTANLYDNQTRASSLILGGTANYRPFRWFRNRLTIGYNQTVSQADIFYAPGQMAVRLAADPTGYVAQRIPQQRIYTLDYAGTISTPLTSTIASDFSLGMQFLANRGHYLYADGTGLSSPFTRLVSAAAKTTGAEADSAANSLGFFGQEQVGFNDRLFLTVGVRMDNSSVFGDRINRIFYPKVSASYVLSQEPWFRLSHVDNLRVRAAWGQAGKAPGVYAATRTYSASVVTLANHTSAPAVIDSVYGNADLKPERGEEIEAGFDASLFGNRAGVEFTYYNKHMRNGLLRVDVPPSSGFSGTYLQNLAEIANHGLEVSLSGTPIQSRNLSWDARLNLATNSNKLVKFGVVRPPIISATYAPSQRVQEGYPVYGFWRVDPKKDASGNVLLVNGLPQRGDSVYVGPSQPTREAFFSSTITILRNLTVFGLLDYKGGFYQFNVRDWRRARAFLTKDVLDPNADKTKVALWTSTFITTDWIQPGDFIKFRELSLTYALPTSLVQQLHADRASLTLGAHNLGILWTRYGGLDPEANFNGAEDFIRNDAWTVPQQRRLTASLNVSF